MRFVIAFFEKSLATLFTFVLEIVPNVFFVNLFNVIRQISLWNKSLFTLPARKSNFENAITFMLILLIFGLEGQAAVFIGALIRAVWCMFCKKMRISRLKSLSISKLKQFSQFKFLKRQELAKNLLEGRRSQPVSQLGISSI